jgi:hypothetical protein
MRGDSAAYNVSTQPTPALLNATGHALLRSIANGQSDHLLAAADAITRLAALLPDASAEGRLIAALLAVSVEDPAAPAAGADAATPTPTPTPAPARQPTPHMDDAGQPLVAFRHEGVPFVSQLVAGKWLGLSHRQLVRLEDRHQLDRKRHGPRCVGYALHQVRELKRLITAGAAMEAGADAEIDAADPTA